MLSGCGRRLHRVPRDVREREIRDLPVERIPGDRGGGSAPLALPRTAGFGWKEIEQLPSKAPFNKRFEEIVGEACESAAGSQVAHDGFTRPRRPRVRAIDLRYLERWDQRRRKPALKQMGVDEIYRGKSDKISDGSDE